MRRRTWLAVGATAASLTAGGAVAPVTFGHGITGHGLGEREVQRLETKLLGPRHAAEHRMSRAQARRAHRAWKRMTPAERRRARRLPARMAATGVPADEGRWTAPFDMPVIGVHAAVLPTGKVMLFSQAVHDYRQRKAAAYLWDPTKAPGEPGEFKAVPPADNIWCGGQSLMADGQLLVTGGNLDYGDSTLGFSGLNTVFTFDPWTERWTRQPDMARGRWYPTQTLLPDGRTLITSGFDETGGNIWNTDIDVFNPPSVRGGQGTIAKIAQYGQITGAPSDPHWYPHWFVMPSGKVLNAGFKASESWLLDATPGRVSGENRPDWSMSRKYGSAVLLPGSPTGSTRVMQLGGYNAGTGYASVASTEIFDEANPSVRPQPGPVMQVPRTHQNTVLLPDRSMVNVGGGSGEVPGTESDANVQTALADARPEHRQVEILDPGATEWRLGPAQAYKRSYHSTAVLLPDGRVLSAGDDRDPAKGASFRERDFGEIYEPAYLHKPGPRPAISAAPDSVAYGQPFDIGTSTPVTSAVLIAPGATTHANDMHQRLVPLDITPTDGGARLAAPPSANVAPPGYYMLFALSADGKPSVAKWVHVGGGAAGGGAPAPTPLPTPPAKPAAGDANTPAPAVPVTPGPAPTVPRSPSTPATPSRDTAAPKATVRLQSRASELRRRGRLVLKVALNEPGRVQASARIGRRGTAGVRVPRRGSVSVTYKRPQTRTIVLRLSSSERRRLSRSADRVTLSLALSDTAGNRAKRTLALRLPR